MLALLQNGAEGQTLDELSRALQLGNANKSTIVNRFNTLLSPMEKNKQMAISNGVFLDSTHKMMPAFITAGNQLFANVTNVNFSDIQNSANQMNNWISSETNGQIQYIISAKSVRDNEMIVFSSYYFHGIWQNGFHQHATRIQKFFNGNCAHAQAQHIEMMFASGTFKYANISTLRSQVVQMPFADSQVTFLLILPWVCDGLPQVEQLANTFDWTHLNEMFEDGEQQIGVTMPKFKIAFNSTLKGSLSSVSSASVYCALLLILIHIFKDGNGKYFLRKC